MNSPTAFSASLPAAEIGALTNLWQLIQAHTPATAGRNQPLLISEPSTVVDHTLCYSVEQQQVSGLFVRNCALTELPAVITQLTRLKHLDVTGNRLVTLPASIDEAKITAEFNDGVLKVTLPKSEKVKPTRIQVKGQG